MPLERQAISSTRLPLTQENKEAIKRIREMYGLTTDRQAIKTALQLTAHACAPKKENTTT